MPRSPVLGAVASSSVMCPVEHQESVRTALAPMKDLPISVDPYGSRVILNVHRNIWS